MSRRLLLVAALLAGCAPTGFATTPRTATTAPAATTPAPATSDPNAAFRAKVGTPAIYSDGWKVTVQKWAEQPAGRFSTPKPGQRFIAVTVRYDNGSAKDGSFNIFDWSLQDSAGVRHTIAIFAGERSDSLGSGPLAPGAFVTGSVQFEAPVGDTKLEMLYTSIGLYKLATWELY